MTWWAFMTIELYWSNEELQSSSQPRQYHKKDFHIYITVMFTIIFQSYNFPQEPDRNAEISYQWNYTAKYFPQDAQK